MVDIIDDDDAVRQAMKALLESYGYVVRDHSSAEHFLGHTTTPPDCLLVDQNMPGMSGIDLLEHLRAGGDRTPALIMTGRSDAELEPRLARIGVRLLCKPVPENELVRWLQQAHQGQA